MLEITDLSVSFNSLYGKMHILDKISLEVKPKEIVAIVGESGSGKSVTALSILGLLDQNAMIHNGSISFKNKNLLQLSEKELQKLRGKEIGIVFQEPMTALNPTMKIGIQLANVIRKHLGISKTEANKRAIEALTDVKIKDPEMVFHQYPFQLSGGMRQRVVIALAMSAPPDLLIADEPTTALDVTVQNEILQLMQELKLQKGTSILLITHDLGVVANTCDRVYVMYGGKIVEQGTTQEVLYQTKHPYTKALLESIPEGKNKKIPLKVLSGEAFSPLNRPQGCVFIERCPIRGERCLTLPPVLEGSTSHLVSCWEVK